MYENKTQKGQSAMWEQAIVKSAVKGCMCGILCVGLCASPDQQVKLDWIQQGPWPLQRNSTKPTWQEKGGGGWVACPSAVNAVLD